MTFELLKAAVAASQMDCELRGKQSAISGFTFDRPQAY
jgi:hypothetical protein